MLAALRTLASEDKAREVLGYVMELIKAVTRDEEEVVPIRRDVDMEKWTEGVEAYRNLTDEEVAAGLGLTAPCMPFFNTKQDPEGDDDPWSAKGLAALEAPTAVPLQPRWHQWVGVLRIMDNMFSGKHMLLMDQVGVGKSMQAVGAIAMYQYQRMYWQRHGRHTDHFSE